jgi:hypothetical protein
MGGSRICLAQDHKAGQSVCNGRFDVGKETRGQTVSVPCTALSTTPSRGDESSSQGPCSLLWGRSQ